MSGAGLGGSGVCGSGAEPGGDTAHARRYGASGHAASREEDRRARVVLSGVAEPGDHLIGRILARHGAAETVDRIRSGGALESGASPQRAEGYRMRLRGPGPDEVLDEASSRGIQLVCPGEPGWPSQLDALGERRPTALWVRGSVDLRVAAVRSVAVVGARDATAYGSHVAAELGLGLAERCWCVVSGAAFGIDIAAHRGALATGATVAVLACGVDVAYPRGHAAVLERIAATGAVVAELPPGTRPTRYRFLERNRVIAALSRGTVVVEAAVRSGALRTAHEAAALGRHVMGVPGPVTSEKSAGVHELLRDGATVVCDAAQVIENVALVGEELAPARMGERRPTDELGADLTRVLEAVPADRAGSPDEIAAVAGIGPGGVLAALGALAAGGWVAREDAGWRLARSLAGAADTPRGRGRPSPDRGSSPPSLPRESL